MSEEGIGELPARRRRRPSISPNARTVALYRSMGYLAEVVERYDHHVQRLHDFLGMFDVIALKAGDTVGLQPTTDSHVAHRVDKIRRAPCYEAWLKTGARVIVVGWKLQPDGKWRPREVELTMKTHPPLACDPLLEDA